MTDPAPTEQPSTPEINLLGTSNYRTWQPWMGVAIATSIGKPKWMPGIDKINSVTPFGVFGQYDTEFAFRVAYEKRLDDHAEQVQRDLLTMSARYPGQRLVLLCWCNVAKGDWCHRRMLADWLEQKGVQAPEMTLDMQPPREYVPADGPGPQGATAELLFGSDFG